MNTVRKVSSLAAAVFLALPAAPFVQAATATISNPPGNTTAWNDTGGNRIKNNCGGMLQDGGTFYWYGWDPTSNTVNCYTSTTLGSSSWTKVSNGNFPMFGSGFHGRPDVIKHPTNGTYVMVVEFSSVPGRNGIEYLTSTSPTGPFVSQQKDDFVLGGISMGDKGLYQDDDASKTAYLLCTTDDGGVNNSTTKIVKLNANYIGQNSVIQSWTYSPKREALAMFKRNGIYYLTASRTLGWSSSETPYKTASSITGTFTQWATMPTNPTSTDSFDTQHDFIVTIVGSSTTSYFYMGDRWGHELFPSDPTKFNNNAWYPITFDNSAVPVPTLQGNASWTINAATGVINGTPQTLTVAPSKDAMVKFAAPTTNFGTSNQLQVSAQTNFQKQMFLQFNVTTLPAGATVLGSNLLINSQTGATGRAITVHSVSSTSWTETGITWNTKPTLGTALDTVSTHAIGVDSNWDLGTYITGNGNVAVGLDSAYSGDTNFNSREATDPNVRPELVITYQP